VRRKQKKLRSGVIAALDVGTTKICCFVARVENGVPRVIGIGHQVSRGVRSGAIVNMEDAERSILNAVSAAETMAGETLHAVVVNLSGGHPQSRAVGIEVSIAGHEVGDADVRRAMEQVRQAETRSDRHILHAIPVGYTIDGSRGIRDPRGMCGEKLGVNMHIISANSGVMRNLDTCIAHCHLDIDSFVASPYVSGLSVLVEDEMDLGVTVVDMGGGVTSLAVFFEGCLVHTDFVPVGGGHVTNDIARGLSTPVIHAERMKTLYGSCVASPADQREIIDVPLVGEEDHAQANHVPKSILTGIIQPRLEETFELVRSRLEASGFDKLAGRRVVLTGGASQLQGARELAAMVLDKQVRMGRPSRITGLSDQTGGPAFATAAGLIHYAQQSDTGPTGPIAEASESGSLLGRLGIWLKEHL